MRMVEHGWTVSRFIRESGVGRATIYDWLKTDSARIPQVEKVQLYAANLRIPYEPYAEALGWTESEAAPPRDLVGFIERARRLADHPKTSPERKRVLEARIAEAEFRQRAALDMERTAEALLREALGEDQDASGQ